MFHPLGMVMIVNPNTTVVVAMSGGVDSSVAALLLKEAGYRVIGVTMKLYSLEQTELPSYYRGCCTVDDVEDARAVCRQLGVPHYVFNVQSEFRSHVIDYFTSEYASGRTPHPCIACNDKIKFSFLMQRAHALDAQFVATGHYARVAERDGEFTLMKSVDASKDQSYVLFGVGQQQLSHMLLPAGWYTKEQIRQLAVDARLPNSNKPDSQDICFIPLGDYREFLSQRLEAQPGLIVDTAGNVLGEHQGIHLYTVGQRRGLGIQSSSPMYVVAIDAEAGDVVVGTEEELYNDSLWTTGVNYISARPPDGPTEVSVKVRYKSSEAPAVLHPDGTSALVRFETPQRALTPGQAAVFYQGDRVLGGGYIEAQRVPLAAPASR